MAIPTTKSTFKDYCFRALGSGVIDINVSDDQADDRIDEALQFFAQYHYDGIEKMYLKHLITFNIYIHSWDKIYSRTKTHPTSSCSSRCGTHAAPAAA